MNVLYLDIFSGISGDMFVGAMIDLGVDAKGLEAELNKLGLEDYHLHVTRKTKANIAGTKFDVHLHDHDHDHNHDHNHGHEHDPGHDHAHAHQQEDGSSHTHSHSHRHAVPHAHSHPESGGDPGHSHAAGHGRTFADIKKLIRASTLSDWVKDRAIAVFQRVANAEGKIHGAKPDDVHFHEVGAVDSIVDIVGSCIALEMLGRPRVFAADVVEGKGWVDCAHGRFPIPTAATLEILGARGAAVTQSDEPHELVTPTGAALLAEFAESFGPMRGLVATKVGYGLGTRDNLTRPNVLRAVLGEIKAGSDPASEGAGSSAHDWETDTITVLETNLDDSTPEMLGHFAQKALAAGALDVFHTPVQMKKNRPGNLLTLLCAENDSDRFVEMILRETSAFGVRRHRAERRKLRRESRIARTAFGDISVKIGWLDKRAVQISPEYESCRQAAERCAVALKEVYQAAIAALKL